MTIKCPKCRFENPDETAFCGKCGASFGGEAGPTETRETVRDELTTGSLFAGRYQIIEELGKGGMGRVYKAIDSKINEKIALKLIKPEIAADRQTIERFGNELKLSRKISHRNVCRMFDLGEDQENHFITMEYVSGEDLKSMLRMMGRMSPAQTVSIGIQICEGLAEAHRLGIIHRDLKPQNIMIDRDGGARIMDFGIARSIETKGLTGPGIMIGTPEYMSPEQAEAGDLDATSDLYSLGVILYEMVTGELPFKGDTPLSVAMKHKGEKPRDPREINALVPLDLSGLILKCLAKDKAGRYQSAGEVLEELERIQAGLPRASTVAPKATLSTSKEITVSFRPKRLIIPAAAVLFLAALAVLLLLILPGKKPLPIPGDKPSLAVLYFENNSGDDTLENWRSGLSEMLITDLSQSKFLHVLSGDRIYSLLDSFDLLDKDKYATEDLKRIASRAGVSHILRGNFITAGEKFIINVSLMKGSTAEVIRSLREEGMGEISISDSVDRITTLIKSDLNMTDSQVRNDIDRELVQITSRSPEAYKYYAEGRRVFYSGDVRASISYYERAIAADPEFAMAYRALSIAYNNLGLMPMRKRYMAKAMELKTRLPDRYRYLIEGDYFAISERTYDHAIPAYEKALELYPDDTTINHNYAIIYYEREEWEKAIPYYERAIKAGSFFASTYRQLARAYRAVGEFDKAQRILESGLECVSDKSEICRGLAQHFLITGEEERALAAVEDALRANPENLIAYNEKGRTFLIQGEFGKAEEAFLRLLNEPEPTLQYFGLNGVVDLSLSQGKYQAAAEYLSRGIALCKSVGVLWPESEWHSTQAYADIQTDHFDEAIEEAQRAFDVAVEADDGKLQRRALHLKSLALIRSGAVDQAERTVSELRQLIAKSGQKTAIRLDHHLRGEIAMKKRDGSKAIDELVKAVALAVNQSDALFSSSLAQAYTLAGQLENAREEYIKVLNLRDGINGCNDLVTMSHYRLGIILKDLGQDTEAVQNLETFLSLWKDADPNLPEVEDAKKRLAALTSN